ncbi:hypothetical protein COCMIDRAFT_82856 [Bipolaris oryzae ATCC 44560]|uniref:Uncharacterized protein n=1 Tax=Bipolaris oryzae ATCC 44560 TaxID=930090 RepID=W7A201_COCMI|nr:uncharacterized protein COCMIDRAFT_82856 [Bipolaris oryzae ATCC 44560]EUC50056.1 hypothetical protein COCMIDRAFT_82856 [Bipolaris oryzae ATCC 44560]
MPSRGACLGNLNADQGADLEYLQRLQSPRITSGSIPYGWRLRLSKIISLPQTDLDNDIHPLFQSSRWPDLRPEDYTLLLPALRIASKFMSEPVILKWWKHTLFGEVKLDKTRRRYLASTPYETSNYANNELHVLLIKKLPHVLELMFENLDKNTSRTDGCAFGSNAAYIKFRHDLVMAPVYPFFDTPRILLHSQYWFSLKYLLSHGGSAHELKTVYLRMAITLCHELTHVVWHYRISRQVMPWALEIDSKEPLHQASDRLAEFGHSWEHYVFGGSIWTLDRPGFFTTFYKPHNLGAAASSFSNACVVVPHWWINMWSSTGMWSQFEDLYRGGEIRLPGMWESGYSLCQGKTDEGWTLHKRGVAQLGGCRTPEASVFYLWHVVRPILQVMLADMQSMGGSRVMRRLHTEFYELLRETQYVDESSPETFRLRRR